MKRRRKKRREDLDVDTVARALQQTDWSFTETAIQLNTSYSTIKARAEEYGLFYRYEYPDDRRVTVVFRDGPDGNEQIWDGQETSPEETEQEDSVPEKIPVSRDETPTDPLEPLSEPVVTTRERMTNFRAGDTPFRKFFPDWYKFPGVPGAAWGGRKKSPKKRDE